MIKVANKKVINHLAFKSFKASKIRNIFAIVAIALTTILFASLFTIGIGMLENFQNETIRQSGGEGHAVLKYITDNEYNKIKNHPLISEISYNKIIADSVDNPEFLKRNVEMYYMDNTAMKFGFCETTTGNIPTQENEIITDTKTLDLLGVAHEIGAKVPLTYTVKGKQINTNFILSGYWESEDLLDVGFAIVSRTFMDAHSNEMEYTYKKDLNMAGSINSYIMFKNSHDLASKLNKIITDSGYTVYDETLNNHLTTDINSNVNWAYLSSNFASDDPGSLIAMLMAIMLIIFTGYLIIYNIFEISVIKDIRFYGLLKTIGTTPEQIKRIITRQAVMLSIIGIPIGLVIGFLTGKGILPMIAETTSLGNSKLDVSLNPVIFMGASLFSIVTVFISTRKPGKIASKVSPVEAVRYNENNNKISKKIKKTTDGGKLWKMAYSNLGRNKKRTFIVIMSMTLSVVLLNSVFTISRGFDMDKYLSRFVDTDFLIGHANYFNVNHEFRFAEDELNESFIKAVQEQPGFEIGGKIYKNIGQCSVNYNVKYDQYGDSMDEYGEHINLSQHNKPELDLYGLDDLPLSRLDIVYGEKNLEVLAEKMKTGKYIIEGLCADDYNVVYANSSHYDIGDIITVNIEGKSFEYELLAKSRIKGYSDSNRMFGNIVMYLPSQEYIRIDPKPVVMTYGFQVAGDKEVYMDDFLKYYTDKEDSMMDYESKQKWVNSFKSFRNMVISVGGILCFIIGLIGILNFVNSVLTSVISRRQEFAMLQSIGMTRKQLNKMLCFEGLYYAVATILVSFILSALFSVTVIGEVVGSLWFFSYKFVIKPLLITYPILIVLSSLTPYIAYNCISRQSIVERLREVE